MNSLSDRLKNLGVHLGSNNLPANKKKAVKRIEDIIAGFDHTSHFGDTFIVDNTYPEDLLLGVVRLRKSVNLRILAQWANTPNLEKLELGQLAFVDTETSGLAGGTGTFAFLVGIGFFGNSEFHVLQFFMRDPGCETALLASLNEYMNPFKAIVTYNGKAFDLPLLSTRHILHGFLNPFAPLDHVDLLPLARRLWRNRLPNRGLKDIEIDIFKMQRGKEEVPGWMVPEIYFNYLKTGDASPLAGVFYHNAMDIVSLAVLFGYIDELLTEPLENPETPALDLAAIGKLYADLGHSELALDIFRESLKQGLPHEVHLPTLERMASILKSAGRWDEAGSLWEQATECGDINACIALSKWNEHTRKDPATALEWAEQVETKLKQLPPGSRYYQLYYQDTIKRIARLKKKMSR